MKYRSEIDGLRAIAVVPVILFHAGFETFSGGFVGVDVFFVISGYLITSLILLEVEQGRFSIINFYERRARRILPALFLVMLVCIPFGWLVLPAPDMKDFSKSLVAVSLFASNILFWRQSGYFDTAAELKPLLHTWSLAVEEQYYVLFPLCLLLAWRLGKRWMLILLVLGGLLSLALAQWGSLANPSAAFFLLPTRGWELLLGAVAAAYLSRSSQPAVPRLIAEVGGTLGLVLIAYAVLAYRNDTPFPGLYALVPTIGALLIILFATQQTSVGRFIGNRAFAGIGLISYSAYLWHQPLFVFDRYLGHTNSKAMLLIFACASLVLAYLTWRCVERPFRNRQRTGRGLIFSFALVGTLFFTLIGFAGYKANGFPDGDIVAQPKPAITTSENFIVLGDSHGAHLISGLKAVTTGNVLDYTSNGCIPFRNVDRYDSRFVAGDCARKVNEFLAQLSRDDPDAYVIISSMGPVYLDGTPFNGKNRERVTGLHVELITDRSITDPWRVFELGLTNTLAELSRLKRAKVVLAVDVPELGIDYGCWNHAKKLTAGSLKITDFVTRVSPEQCYVSRRAYDERAARYRTLVQRVASRFPKVKIFDPTEQFCDASICKGYDPRYGYLYRDVDHLSASGSVFYAERLIESLSLR